MKCTHWQRSISDALEGGGEPNYSESQRQHLRECPACRGFERDLRALGESARALSNLSREQEPGDHVWDGIVKAVSSRPESGITPGEREAFRLIHLFKFQPAALGWVAGIAFASLVLFMTLHGEKQLSSRTGIVDDSASAGRVALSRQCDAESDYTQAIDLLTGEISRLQINFSSSFGSEYHRNLEIIDRSILSCKEALQQQPDNQIVCESLVHCYRSKLTLLKGFSRIPQTRSES
jgi:hypothetical protein